jgi:CVNH domain
MLTVNTRWHGENFNETARDVRLGGSILYADLMSPEGTWNATRIDLNKVVGNDDGQLVNGNSLFSPSS